MHSSFVDLLNFKTMCAVSMHLKMTAARQDISSIDDGKLRYDMFVKAYNETREHGGINGLTPSEKFLQTFNVLGRVIYIVRIEQ
jgi:hypothetical protein